MEGLDNLFSDSWHKNDSLWRIREIPFETLMHLGANLPPPQESKHELARADCLDPIRRCVFHVIWIRRKSLDGTWRWFIHQVEFNAL